MRYRRPSSTNAPGMWLSLAEHFIKTIFYSLFVIHAVQSAQRSSTTFSYWINSIIGLFALWMVKGEVDIAIKRLQLKLPPGCLGFPIHREIKFLQAVSIGGCGLKQELKNSRRKYGTIFTDYFLGRLNVLVGGQDDLTWLFSSDRNALTEISWPPNIAMLFGPGAVGNQTGKYHRALRRLMEPYFAPKFVTNYLAIIDQTTVEELDSWSSSGEFLSSELFKMYALKLFYAASFGRVDEDVIVTLHDDFKIWLGGFFAFTTKRIPGTSIDKGMKARDRIRKTLGQLIDKFMKENSEESERSQTTVIGRLIYGKDKQNNRMMTHDEIKDNLLNLIFAGHDTTYASISTLLYHLSQNPNVMEALAEEVSTLSEPLRSDELKGAPILNACIHESWRMDPPVGGGFRKAVKDIQHKGYSFDNGTIFNYSIFLPLADESLYKNHDKFNMTRFLPKDHPLYQAEMDAGIDPLQGRTNYPIFGGGSHACLGKAFAQLELRVLAARMMKHYKVEVRNPQRILFPFNGWNIEFKLTKMKDE